MRFLPVVHRELLALSRRPSTFWMRSIGGGMLVLLLFFLLRLEDVSPTELGQLVFSFITSFLCIGALLYGILHGADCISRERREGTLGLLFLTPLRSYDIFFGKLISRILDGLQFLLVATPILSLCLLFGGLSSKALLWEPVILISLLFFSFSISLLVSTLTESSIWAFIFSFLLVSFFAILPLLIAITVVFFFTEDDALLFLLISLSPLGAHLCLLNAELSASSGIFQNYFYPLAITWGYISISTILSLSLLHRAWRKAHDFEKRSIWHALLQALRRKNRQKFHASGPKNLRVWILNRIPLVWLLFRHPYQPIQKMIGILILPALLFLWFFIIYLHGIHQDPLLYQDLLSEVALVPCAVLAHFVLRLSFAITALRYWVVSAHQGTLPLLLTSPLKPKDWLLGQIGGLSLLYLPASLAVILLFDYPVWDYSPASLGFLLLHTLSLPLDLAAIALLALWIGPIAKGTIQGMVAILWRIFLPWIFYFPYVLGHPYDNPWKIMLYLKSGNALLWIGLSLYRILYNFRAFVSEPRPKLFFKFF